MAEKTFKEWCDEQVCCYGNEDCGHCEAAWNAAIKLVVENGSTHNNARDEIFAYIDDWEAGCALGTEEWSAVCRCSKMLRQKLSPVAHTLCGHGFNL